MKTKKNRIPRKMKKMIKKLSPYTWYTIADELDKANKK